jgi:hypothetical protein
MSILIKKSSNSASQPQVSKKCLVFILDGPKLFLLRDVFGADYRCFFQELQIGHAQAHGPFVFIILGLLGLFHPALG